MATIRDPSWICIDDAEERSFGDEFRFGWVAALNKGCGKVEEISVPLSNEKLYKALMKLRRGDFFAISGLKSTSTDSDEVRLSTSSGCKVFAVGSSFHFDQKIVDKYRNPDEVQLSEVQSSPLKRRVSVRGVVSGSIEERGSDKKRMKELEVSDGSCDPVKVCLWREKADLDICVGEEVRIGPLSVCLDRRSKIRKLHSVADTTLERKKTCTFTVIAVSDANEFPMELLVQGGGNITLERSFGVSFERLPITVEVERSNDNKVLSMSIVDLDGGAMSETDV